MDACQNAVTLLKGDAIEHLHQKPSITVDTRILFSGCLRAMREVQNKLPLSVKSYLLDNHLHPCCSSTLQDSNIAR